MGTLINRLDQVSGEVGGLLRLASRLFEGFGAAWGRLMERNAARAHVGNADDDILWDTSEPDDQPPL
jgi:hypothetical protein